MERRIDSFTARVGVIGGGYAGMAAAVALAERGISVGVYESARQLGGRARGLTRHGVRIDNGQHILIGAYRDTLAMAARVNTDASCLLRLPLAWRIHPQFELKSAPLPAPWHLAAGIVAARGVGIADRIACVRFLSWCRRVGFRLERDTTVAALMREQRQPDRLLRYLWYPLCIAALNTPPEVASAQVLLNVIRDGLAADRHASDLVFARVDLTALFPTPAAEYVRAHGGNVHLDTGVSKIEADDRGFELITSQGAHRHEAVIIATQPDRVTGIAGHIERLAPALTAIGRFSYFPIVTIYLQYERRPCLPGHMLGLAEGCAQWLFDREAISGAPGLVAAVISAKGRAQALAHATLAERVHAEIASLDASIGAPRWTQVIEEKRATFGCVAGIERPDQLTPVPGLFLAGDYTASDYPATLEAAVRSGLRTARLAARHLGAHHD